MKGKRASGQSHFVMPEAAPAAIRHLRAGTVPKIPDKRLAALSGMTIIKGGIGVLPAVLPLLPI